MNKAAVVTEIDESLEEGIGTIHALKPSGAALPHARNAKDEVSATNLGILFRQMIELSTREVDTLNRWASRIAQGVRE